MSRCPHDARRPAIHLRNFDYCPTCQRKCERCKAREPLPGKGSRWCLPCFQWVAENGLPPVKRDTCGTHAGWMAHKHRAENLCSACRDVRKGDSRAA